MTSTTTIKVAFIPVSGIDVVIWGDATLTQFGFALQREKCPENLPFATRALAEKAVRKLIGDARKQAAINGTYTINPTFLNISSDNPVFDKA